MAAYDLKNEIIEEQQKLYARINRMRAQLLLLDDLDEQLGPDTISRLARIGILPGATNGDAMDLRRGLDSARRDQAALMRARELLDAVV